MQCKIIREQYTKKKKKMVIYKQMNQKKQV